MQTLFENNFGLKTLKQINDIINGNSNTEIEIELSPHEMSCFKWCPITNSEVERSFSRYKWILSDRRMRFEEDNLKKYIVINSNTPNLN